MNTRQVEAEPRAQARARVIFLIVAAFFTVYLFRYYMTGIGGPSLIAITLVPVTFILFTLDGLRSNSFYPSLGAAANYFIAAVYIGVCLVVILYMNIEFMNIRTVRAGIWNTTDLAVGGLMFVLVMEYCRKVHFPLFVINLFLIGYGIYGSIVPGLFWHPGLSWTRVVSAMSVEMTTGVFSHLPQLALTLIGSFLLVLSVLRAFGCVDSIINAASRLALKSSVALPQAAVIGSLGVATISGSGAANAATTGSATIPAMIASGLPRATAAAIETASSLGGQLMPPIMGISAFIMAEFLGKSYWEVVARGYAPALIYFAGVIVGVYLLSIRYQTRDAEVSVPRATFLDKINLIVYAVVIIGLVVLMGVFRMPAMVAALRIFIVVGLTVSLIFLVDTYRAQDAWSLRRTAAPFLRLVDNFASVTTDLTLLLATLSIMTGVFVITGIPTKVGFLLIEAAGLHLSAMILVAFFFAALVGTGLPPAPTYIITALVIAPAMMKVGVDPWVVHFYAFFLAVWGELTPPTSVVAAVAAKIAEASFMGTLFRAIKLCAVLFVLMGGIFARPELILQPGFAQLATAGLFLVSTIGLQFSLQARYSEGKIPDILVRTVLAVLSLAVVFHPSDLLATILIIPIAAFVGYWIVKKRKMRFGSPLVFDSERVENP